MLDLESAKVRDTLDILWTSLATIFMCTYTILHLKVPRQRQGRDPGWRGDIKWSPVWRNLKWSIVTILAPEVILATSFDDWRSAKKQLRRLHQAKPETTETWQMTHMLFAVMGGFAVEVRNASSQPPTSTALASLHEDGDAEKAMQHANPPKIYHLPARTVVDAIEKGLLPTTIVPVDEILDRSKSTFFTKLLTLGQTLYFLVQFCVRCSKGLPTTPLEVGVVGFLVCGIFTYLCVLYKPKDVNLVTTLKSYENALPEDIRLSVEEHRTDELEVPHEIAGPLSTFEGTSLVWVVPLGIIIGAIHLGGWNLDYATIVDTWLWRGASSYLTFAGFAVILCYLLMGSTKTSVFIIWLLTVFYAIARLVILMEMFKSLFYLPAGAFVSTWTDNVPHVG